MFQRFVPACAVLSALWLSTLPSAATVHHAHHAVGHSRVVLSHSTHARKGRAGRAERVSATHHEPAPGMDSTRATAIQAALIRAGYLSGEPSGVWDANSIAAMQRLQDANGWQTKYTPDSRALVKLGLGSTPGPATQLGETAEGAPAALVIQQP